MLHLQFARSIFFFARSICSSHVLFAVSLFYWQFACYICSSRALISTTRALFAVRALFSIPRAPFAARMLWFPFHVLQLQLAHFNILAFFFTARALDRAIRALLFLHMTLCCGLWHMKAKYLIVIILLLFSCLLRFAKLHSSHLQSRSY